MEISDLAQNWNTLGRQQTITSIISTLDFGDEEAFFQSGLIEVEWLLALLSDINIQPSGPALDFGCGIGRLTQALACHFDDVVGVDIAPSMLEIANARNAFPEKCRYLLNQKDNLAIFGNEEFNLIMTSIVLQHVGPELAKKYLAEMIRILKPGGILFFQLPSNLKEIPILDNSFCRATIRAVLPSMSNQTCDTPLSDDLKSSDITELQPRKRKGFLLRTKDVFTKYILKNSLRPHDFDVTNDLFHSNPLDQENILSVSAQNLHLTDESQTAHEHWGLSLPVETTIPVRVKITNDSDQDWESGHEVTLSRRWLSYPEYNLLAYADDGSNILLGEGLGSKESTEVTMMLRTPIQTGNYILELDLSQPGRPLFGDLGSNRYSTRIKAVTIPAESYQKTPAVSDLPVIAEPQAAEDAQDDETVTGDIDNQSVVGTIEMHGILRQEVEAFLLDHNMEIIQIIKDDSAGIHWESYRYLARRNF